MFRIRYICIMCFILINLSKAQRRIVDGRILSERQNKNGEFVVYLIKANQSVPYDAWMCGGAIVSRMYIVTSAACVEDVKYMYAIAGYKKYVKYDDIHTDRCTSRTKKKIVYLCLPRDYNFDYPKMEQWAKIDIALAKVESAFNFDDSAYQEYCSYKPRSIGINYDLRLQAPGTDAIVLGWGHTEKYRSTDDTQDHNRDELRWGAVRLANKAECKTHFPESQVKRIIDKYMICSMLEGSLDIEGETINEREITYEKECGPGSVMISAKCVSDYYRRRKSGNVTLGETRRRGICQNDHGGPIITWRGPKPVLIGIASAFKVEGGTKKCTAPYLYTSTHCNGYFLNCILKGNSDGKLSEFGDKSLKERCIQLAKEGGFSFVRRSISWSSHPDGPAVNEGNALREMETGNEPDQENTPFRSPFQFKSLGL